MLQRVKEVCPGLYYGVAIVIWILIIGGLITLMVCAGNDEIEWGLCVLGGAVLLALALQFHLILAGYFYFAAVDKGYSDLFYLRLAFGTLPVGAMLVIALPDRGGKEALPVFDDELPDL